MGFAKTWSHELNLKSERSSKIKVTFIATLRRPVKYIRTYVLEHDNN